MKIIPILIISLLLLGCSAKVKETKQTIVTEETLKGVSLSPKSFSPEDFTGFFNTAKEANSIITWAGDWAQLEDSKSAPYVVAALSKQYDYTPVILLGAFEQSTGRLLRPLTDEQIELYASSAAEFAKKYNIKYMGIGVEVNYFKSHNGNGFNRFLILYEKSYDAIKAASPGTQIFTVFQLEQIKGRNDGLFGGSKQEPEWGIMDSFPKNDLAVFTTYPGLIFKNPSDIPEDYYSEISQKTSKPIAFSEIGWQSKGVQGWESSEEKQSEFINRFFILAKPLKPKFLIWSFLYDQKIKDPFGSSGLFKNDGTEKSGWKSWKEN